MKNYVKCLLIYISIQFLISENARSQTNLVPNPSFEDTLSCPYSLDRLYFSDSWHSCRGTPDYFNACSWTGTQVPNSVFGYQVPHSGNAFAGVMTYLNPNNPDGPDYREYIICELDSVLQIGEKYYFSFFTNYSHYHPNQAVASNNIGLTFSTVLYDSINNAPITNSARIWSSQIITDTVNWLKFSGSFQADSAYKYLLLGNFFDDNHTDTITYTNIPEGAYYYLDDICISRDSVYNETWTSSQSNISINNDFLIFPNPSNGSFRVISDYKINKIEIYDCLAKLVSSSKPNSFEYNSNLNLSEGIYFIKITCNSFSITKKISITSKN